MNFLSTLVITLFMYCSFPAFISANSTLTIQVNDQSNSPLEHVVISIFPQKSEYSSKAPLHKMEMIDQVDKEFIAHVLPIQVGTAIQFPNNDQIRHHVYSFSTAKTFEIPLYKGMPASPIVFDKTGLVSIGCNIHDWMSAYIYVVATDIFSLTNTQGLAVFSLPKGEYSIHYWHQDIDKKKNSAAQVISIKENSKQTISISLETQKSWSFRRSPITSMSQRGYR